ncbi:MAG: BON domain-containing protein [Magnetococcales bacterium]|nr:BON domain-containing protein [Magnetococcales bacterium]
MMKIRFINDFCRGMLLPGFLFFGGCNLPVKQVTGPELSSESYFDPSNNSVGMGSVTDGADVENDESSHANQDSNLELIQDDRLPRDRLADTKMEETIKRFFQERVTTPEEYVHVDVWEGRLLLTGHLNNPTPDFQKTLRRFLRARPHIRILYDHTQTMPVTNSFPFSQASQASSVRHSLSREPLPSVQVPTNVAPADLTGIEERLAMARGIRPANYRWRIKDNTVYLLGRAVSQTERDIVVNLFQKAPGVLKIEDYIQIKGE